MVSILKLTTLVMDTLKLEVQDTTMGNTIATVVIDKWGKSSRIWKDNNQY